MAAAIVVVVGIYRSPGGWSRLAIIFTATLWVWMGLIYHALFFRRINPAALLFAALFVAQGILLLAASARRPLYMRINRSLAGIAGSVLLAVALAVYPVVSYAFGHAYPRSPTFGLPCPTTLFTLGLLLWMDPVKPILFVIPVLWTLIGFSAAMQLGMYEDTSLIVAGLGTLVILVLDRRNKRKFADLA